MAAQLLFLLCATAVEVHLALLVVTPHRYVRCWQDPAPRVSRRMRLFSGLLFLVILAIQYRLLHI